MCNLCYKIGKRNLLSAQSHQDQNTKKSEIKVPILIQECLKTCCLPIMTTKLGSLYLHYVEKERSLAACSARFGCHVRLRFRLLSRQHEGQKMSVIHTWIYNASLGKAQHRILLSHCNHPRHPHQDLHCLSSLNQ
jgi:hypothetical protein